MSKREYQANLTACHKIIVGEGESDRNFLAAFCARNGITGFEYAFTGVHQPKYNPSGFDCFDKYLPNLSSLAGFQSLTDLVLVCDGADNPNQRLTRLHRQIRNANKTIGSSCFSDASPANQISTIGTPRVHIFMVPPNGMGGLETMCFDVARDTLNIDGVEGTKIEGWVNTFAESACTGWTLEKRDKLRLQAFISAAWKKKPEMHLSQLFDITGDHLIPLDSPTFGPLKTFLEDVAAL